MIRGLVFCGLTVALQAGQAPARTTAIQPSTGTAAIAGAVVADDANRTPLRRVTLTLVRSGFGDMRMTATDDKGRYLFTDLPAGLYTLTATKGAYVAGAYGATKAGLPGGPIPLVDGQAFNADPIALTRGSVISGRITTPSLQGVRSVVVEALLVHTVDGVRRRRLSAGGVTSSTTDSRGTYRIFGLAPGDYVIVARSILERPAADGVRRTSAEELRWAAAEVARYPTGGVQLTPSPDPPLGRTSADAPTYFPGTADSANAAVVALQKGEERSGLDFSLEHVPTARVGVTVVGPGGQPVGRVSLWRFPKSAGATFDPRFSIGISFSGQDGQVSLPAMPPGTYTLLAQSAPGPQSRWGSVDVTLAGEDRTDLQILLEPALSVLGRVVFDGSAPHPQSKTPFAPRIDTTAPYGPSGATALVDSDGSFRINGVIPGSNRLVTPAPVTSPWAPRSAMLRGRDLLDEGFEIRSGDDLTGLVVTYTDRPAELTGTLVDATGRPAPQFYVLVYSTNRAHWTANSRRIRPVRAGVDGSYRVLNLPPGEYFLCALTELEPERQSDPAYLEQFVPASIKISLGESEKKVQPLKIGG